MKQLATSKSSPTSFFVLDLLTREEHKLVAPALQEEFNRSGVLVFPRFFTDAELNPTRAEMDSYFSGIHARAPEMVASARAGQEKFSCDVVPWDPIQENNQAFQAFVRHRRLAQVTEIVLGPGYVDGGSLVMFSVGGGQGQAWHQDCPPDNPADFNLNRLIYPANVSLEDGAIVVVPGSHRRGRIPPGGHQDFIAGEVVLTPDAGTLVLLSGHVFHRVTPNLNRRPRVSVNFRAFPAGTPPDVTCIGIYRNGTVNFCDRAKMHDGTPAVQAQAMERK
jgi:ectoine hydroxylase